MPTRSKLALLAVVLLVAALAVVALRNRAATIDVDAGEGSAPRPAIAPAEKPLEALQPGRERPHAPDDVRVEHATRPASALPIPIDPAESRLRVHGRVMTVAGARIAGTTVEMHGWSGKGLAAKWSSVATTTDATGAFEKRVERATIDAGLGLVSDVEGYLESFSTVDLQIYDETTGIDVVVEAARAIADRVVDADARPMPGATVQLWYGSETTCPTQVDAEGRFLTPTRAPRRAFELIVEAPAHPRRTVPAQADDVERTDIGDVVFRSGGSIAGVVVDARGEPVQALEVGVDQARAADGSKPRTRTDSQGRFEFVELGAGMVGVWIDPQSQGGAPNSRRTYRGGVGPVEVGRRDLKIVAETECALLLRFVDFTTGAPVVVGKVEYGARLQGTPPPAALAASAASSDRFTSVRLSVPSAHRYDVMARAAGFDDAQALGIDVRDHVELSVEIRLKPVR